MDHDSLPLFAYGTMLDRDVRRVVLARTVGDEHLEPARLPGARRVRMPHETYPTLRPDPDSSVDGMLVHGLSALDWQRIAFFESAEYELRTARVILRHGGEMEARYCFEEGIPGAHQAWDLGWWQRHHKATHLDAFQAFMDLFGAADTAQADAYWEEMMATVSQQVARSAKR